MIKVSDYIVQRLVEFGVKDVFMISGGGAMHLNDSVGKNENIHYICNHHEQASAIAAEGYARASGKMAVVIVTSGPGGTNTMTGVIGQWLDSIPVLYISGQVKQETTIASCPEIPLRQLGDQEINITDIVHPVTKFAVTITNPLEIRCLMDKAIHIATTGRPGPVWLDVPLDIQGAFINESDLLEYDKDEDELKFDSIVLKNKVSECINLLKAAKRPIIIAGHGIRIAGAQKLFLKIADKLGVPVVSSMNGFDIITTSNPLFVGRIGTIADRAGNYAIQNCDLLISIGSRNNIRQISYNWKAFAREATKIIVDIDDGELKKPTIIPDLAIHADAEDFLKELDEQIDIVAIPNCKDWVRWCINRKEKYPVCLPEYSDSKELVNPYYFMKLLCECLEENTVLVAGNGTAFLTMFQAGIVKKGQRYIWNSGCASMGYDLPAAIGACFAQDQNDVICLAGDGSLQMNIQELQTVACYRLPIKIFILNNDGYISIKQTQDNFFNGRRVGCDLKSGVSFPDISKIAFAYDLPLIIINEHQTMKNKICEVLCTPGPLVCEVKLIPDYKFSPRNSSEQKPDGRIVSKPLEDLYPFLNREEFESNMIIPILRE